VSGNSIGLWTQLACIWEATARKAGNVHRFQGDADSSHLDFLMAAAGIAPVLEKAQTQNVGRTVLDAVRATKNVVRANVNLGIVLLLAPLAAVPTDGRLRSGIETVLDGLDHDDSRQVFEAIRLAQPGGLGQVEREDVRDEPKLPLRQVMQLATERDRVARQYANGFRDVLDVGVPALCRGIKDIGALEEAVVLCQLVLLADSPDSLIARKLGSEPAAEASRRCAEILAADWPATDESRRRFFDLDRWLRADGNRRNPGTTADLVAASLFVALREGMLKVPLDNAWSLGLCHE
jgi:triphosphoribosyl-dephospho-CoA synthase